MGASGRTRPSGAAMVEIQAATEIDALTAAVWAARTDLSAYRAWSTMLHDCGAALSRTGAGLLGCFPVRYSVSRSLRPVMRGMVTQNCSEAL